jgi:hypothetical protein
MNISTEAYVIGEIPSNVIRIVIDHNLIRIPQPVAAEGYVGRRNGPGPSVEPESIWAPAGKAPCMRRAKASSKVAVLPRMIKMIAWVVPAGIMTNPGLALIYVRSIGVAGLIDVVPGLSRRRSPGRPGSLWRRLVSVRRCGSMRRSTIEWRRPMRRNRWVTAPLGWMLRKHRHSEHQKGCEHKSNEFHRTSKFPAGETPVHRSFSRRPAKEGNFIRHSCTRRRL